MSAFCTLNTKDKCNCCNQHTVKYSSLLDISRKLWQGLKCPTVHIGKKGPESKLVAFGQYAAINTLVKNGRGR